MAVTIQQCTRQCKDKQNYKRMNKGETKHPLKIWCKGTIASVVFSELYHSCFYLSYLKLHHEQKTAMTSHPCSNPHALKQTCAIRLTDETTHPHMTIINIKFSTSIYKHICTSLHSHMTAAPTSVSAETCKMCLRPRYSRWPTVMQNSQMERKWGRRCHEVVVSTLKNAFQCLLYKDAGN